MNYLPMNSASRLSRSKLVLLALVLLSPLAAWADCPTCAVGYPYASTNSLTSVAFNESTVLKAFNTNVTGITDTIRAWYSDEHALALGIRRVIVKTSSGSTITDYPISVLSKIPSSVTNPLVGTMILSGDQAATDLSGRPMFPALYVTDITTNSTARAGDWQWGGAAIPPHAIFGTWKAGVRTVDRTKSPPVVTVALDADPAQNHWNLGAGEAPPAGTKDEGYGAEARWNISDLKLLPGHSYRMYFMVHDGDQNQTGGDSGQGCVTICVPCPPLTATPLTDAVACQGQNVIFSTVVVGGTGPYSYPYSFQWYNEAGALAGQTNSSLLLSNVVMADAGRYWVVVTGSCGSPVTQSAVLTVTPLPILTSAGDKTVELGASWDFDEPRGDYPVTVLSTVTNTAGHCGMTFDATRTWQMTDACGNSAQCSQTVNVVDTTAPVISCSSASKNVECAAAWTFDEPTASDLGGIPTITIFSTVTNTAGHCGNSFDSTRTWQATDACGNFSRCSQTIHVVDTTPPTISCSNDKTVELGAPWSFDQPAASDSCGSATIAILNTATNTECGATFSATRTWQATDDCGNSAQCSQTVSVVDTTPPSVIRILSPTNGQVFVVPADFTLLAEAQDAGGIAKVEFFDGTTKLGETTSGPPYFILLTNVAPGNYTLTAKVTDGCGNAADSVPVSILVIERPPLSIVSAMQYNPQTDFFEETVRVTNPTYSLYDAVRVYVSNLTNSPAITVHNASGSTNGVAYVETHAQVLPGTSVDLRIEFYSPMRVKPNPILRGQLVAPSTSSGAAVVGAGQHINRCLFLPNQSFLVEFASVSNRLYYVQYSTDLKTWKTSQPALTGSGTWIQWLDNGEPKTDSAPTGQSRRFYRVLLLP